MNAQFISKEETLNTLISRFPCLKSCKHDILKAYFLLEKTYENKHKLLVAGNGGSASDSEHIVGELMKSFMSKRFLDDSTAQQYENRFPETGHELARNLEQGLPAVSLNSFTALSTAISNDVGGDYIFAQTLNSIGQEGDVFLGISTSGNSKNIVYAAQVANIKKIQSIGLTGKKECKLDTLCEVTIHVPENETFKIQELHLPIYHALCAMLESHFFG